MNDSKGYKVSGDFSITLEIMQLVSLVVRDSLVFESLQSLQRVGRRP